MSGLSGERREALAKALFAAEQCDRRQCEDIDRNWESRLGEQDQADYRELADALEPLVAGWLAEERAGALREVAVAFGHRWQADMIPAPVVYRALRERADEIGGRA